MIGVYNNVAEELENTKEPIGSYILQECNGKESGYRSYISSFNLFKVYHMEEFTKKFKNVEDRILIDTTISFLKNKMKSNALIDTDVTISCISKNVVKTLKLQPIGVD